MVHFSVVVPVYNEKGNLEKLDGEIRDAIRPLGTFEIIYVDDGSSDGSADVLKNLDATILTFQRNYGQSAALDAGIKQAVGDFIITIDADLQNDPADIPRLFAHMQKEHLDVVAGWRTVRKDSLVIRVITRFARGLRRVFVNDGVHDSGCTLRIYTKAAAKSLELWGEMHRYIIALLRWKGFRVGEMAVHHRARFSGTSKYGAIKAVNGFTDLLFMWFIHKYSRRPLHLFGGMSFLLALTGILIEIWMGYLKLFEGISLSDNAWFPLGFFMLLIAMQLFISGVIIDILLRNYFNSSPTERRYIVKSVRKR